MERVSIRETLIVLVAIVVVGLVTVLVLSRDGAPPTRWRFELGAPASAGPHLDGGFVYAASEAGDVVALDAATGEPRWRATVEGTPRGLIRSDGSRIYFRTDEDQVLALDRTHGGSVWQLFLAGGVNTPLLAGSWVVLASHSGEVIALDAATGEEQWSADSGRTLRADPSLIGTGEDIVAVGDIGGRLHRFAVATGDRMGGEVVFGREFQGPPLQVADVTVIAPTPDVVAITGDREAWRTTTGEPNRVPMVARAGVLYVDASPDLVAIDLASGAVRWRYTSPAVVVTFGVGERLAVAGMHTGEVHGIDLATGERLWRYRTNESVRGAPVIDDATGLAYFAGLDGNVYAIEVGQAEE